MLTVSLNSSSRLDLVLPLGVVACWRRDRRDHNSNLCSSHRRCQLTGISPRKSHGQGPWVNHERHRLDDKLVGKQEDTFLLDILMMGVRFTMGAKAGALRARVTADELSLALPLLAFI